MLNVIGLVLAFADLWLMATTFSATATADDRLSLYLLVPFWTLATVASFSSAHRRNPTPAPQKDTVHE